MPSTKPTSSGPVQDNVRITFAEPSEPGDTSDGTPELDEDDVFHLLQNERRRRVLAYLREHDEGDGIDMREIVEAIAAEEHDTTVQALRSKERQRVYIALYQSHLPKLDDAGVIEYDQRRGWVSRTATTPDVEQYLSDVTQTADRGETVPRETAISVGAVVLLAGYSGYVPVLSDAIVSVTLFGLISALALRRHTD